jgi:hypothetical protein
MSGVMVLPAGRKPVWARLMLSKRSIAGTLSVPQTVKLHALQKSWGNPVLLVVMRITRDSLDSVELLSMPSGTYLQSLLQSGPGN